MIGRTLLKVPRLAMVTKSFPFRLPGEPDLGQPSQLAQYQALDITDSKGSMTLLLGVAGVKWNLVSHLLLNANVLFPLNDQGLRPGVTPVFSFDYTF
jgi:hypothetical protein